MNASKRRHAILCTARQMPVAKPSSEWNDHCEAPPPHPQNSKPDRRRHVVSKADSNGHLIKTPSAIRTSRGGRSIMDRQWPRLRSSGARYKSREDCGLYRRTYEPVEMRRIRPVRSASMAWMDVASLCRSSHVHRTIRRRREFHLCHSCTCTTRRHAIVLCSSARGSAATQLGN